MSTAKRFKKDMGINGFLNCTCCGKRADAVWWGNATICICYNCAVRVLPKIQADVICNRFESNTGNNNLLADSFETIKAEFYRALSIGCARILEKDNG